MSILSIEPNQELEEIANPALKILRISRQIIGHGAELTDNTDLIWGLQMSFLDTSHDLNAYNEQPKIINIINNPEIVRVLRTYRHRCFKFLDTPRIILRWFFFTSMHYLGFDVDSSRIEYIKRENEPDREYYELISTLMDIYDEMMVLKSELNEQISYNSPKNINENEKLESEKVSLIKNWLEKHISKTKSAYKN